MIGCRVTAVVWFRFSYYLPSGSILSPSFGTVIWRIYFGHPSPSFGTDRRWSPYCRRWHHSNSTKGCSVNHSVRTVVRLSSGVLGLGAILVSLALVVPDVIAGLLAVSAVMGVGALAFSSRSGYFNYPSLAIPLGIATAAGLYISALYTATPVSKTSAVIILVSAVAAVLYLVISRDPRRWVGHVRSWANIIILLSIILRGATRLQGSYAFNTGRLLFVQVGEFTRIAVVVAVCAALPLILEQLRGEGKRRWSASLGEMITPRLWRPSELVKPGLSTLVLLFIYLLVLALARDLGPAVLLVAAVALAMPGIPTMKKRWALLWAMVTGAFILVVLQFKGMDRVALLWDPGADAQARSAWDAVYYGGLFSPLSPSAVLHAVPVVATDFMPAAVMAVTGTVPFALLAAALTVIVLLILVDADTLRDDRRPVAVGLAVLLGGLLIWTLLANAAILPLSGLSTPFLVPSPSSIAPALIMLALTKAVAFDDLPDGQRTPARMGVWTRRGGTLVALVVTASIMTATFVLPDGVTRDTAERMARGDIVTRDGEIIASTDDLGRRIYPEGGIYQQFAYSAAYGADDQSWIANRGIERNSAVELACGAEAGILETLTIPIRPPQCRAVDVVSTVDSRIQEAARSSLDGLTGQVAVLDAQTGAILALFDSRDRGLVRDSDGVVDPGRSDMISDDYLERTRAAATDPLRPSFPASTMKLVTAAAALLADIPTSDIDPAELQLPDGSMQNNDGFICPEEGVAAMLTYSCNTTAAALGIRLGADRFAEIAATYFGFDDPVGEADSVGVIDLGAYAPPTLGFPDTAADRRSLQDGVVARSAIGMEAVRANVLNLAAIGAVVANPDTLAPAPHAVAGYCGNGEFRPAMPQDGLTINNVPLPGDIAAVINEGMVNAVRTGTARSLSLTGETVGAKTGTADVDTSDGSVEDTTLIAILAGRYVVATRVEASTSTANSLTVGDALLTTLSQTPVDEAAAC